MQKRKEEKIFNKKIIIKERIKRQQEDCFFETGEDEGHLQMRESVNKKES